MPGLLAESVETVKTKIRFVGGNLEDRISRGVDDGLATFDVLLTELVNNGGSGSVTVAEHPCEPSGLDKPLHQFGRESGILIWEVAPVEVDGLSRQLPVTARGILSCAPLGGIPPGPCWGDGRQFTRPLATARFGCGR